MTPIIYTPVVVRPVRRIVITIGDRVAIYSYPQQSDIEEILSNAPHQPVEVIVVTDGERSSDLAISAWRDGIPYRKTSLYTLCAGINPATTYRFCWMWELTIRNAQRVRIPRLESQTGFGVRNMTISSKPLSPASNEFSRMSCFNGKILRKTMLVGCLIDTATSYAHINDDIQGTGAVTLAGLLPP